MMDDEKAVNEIVYRLEKVKYKIENLDTSVMSLTDKVRKNIVIDNKGLQEEELEDVHKSLKKISSTIQKTIIPQLNDKI